MRNEKGFLMVDLYLQLLILGIVTSSLVVFIAVLQPFTETMDQVEVQELEQFWLEVDQLVSTSSHVRTSFVPCTLLMDIGTDVIRFEKYSSMIRKRKNGTGHELALLAVESCHFKISESQLEVRVTLIQGHHFERVMAIGEVH